MSKKTRRDFLKLAGLTAAGIATKPIVSVLEAAQLPQENPITAKQWAMVIDIRKCEEEKGCTKCIDACHTDHNVPEFDNPKDEIKWLWKEEFHYAFHAQEHDYQDEHLRHTHPLLLCNHCEHPPCVKVCPTQATWKRDKDGIVMMDWHRCIGCRYCMTACPYGARSFNWCDPRPHIDHIDPAFPTRERGVVEKCTFCNHRLAAGLMPSCVEACPVDAMAFGDIEDPNSTVRQLLGDKFTIRRKAGLGTQPQVYYIV